MCSTYPVSMRAICKVVEEKQARKIARSPTDRVHMDLYTASAVMEVYDKLSEANKAKFAAMPIGRMVDITWKLFERAR
jgi:hypothetical protein